MLVIVIFISFILIGCNVFYEKDKTIEKIEGAESKLNKMHKI